MRRTRVTVSTSPNGAWTIVDHANGDTSIMHPDLWRRRRAKPRAEHRQWRRYERRMSEALRG